MALVATYGDLNAFNISIFDIVSGGGYYAVLNDASTPVFQRRNAADGQDTHIYATGNQNVIDRFLSYSYNAITSTLTLTGATNTQNSTTFVRTETYRFVSAYVVEDTWSCITNAAGNINFTNWNYYPTADKIWDIDNTNFGDGTSTKPLGIGIQLVVAGSVYGCIADNGYNNKNCHRKRALASQSGIACTWVFPGDTQLSLSTNVAFNLKQYFFKSAATLTDFCLQSQLAVSAAKGYTGTNFEKMCKVTAYLNINRASNLTSILPIPSNNYASLGLYSRDSFWPGFLYDDSLEQLTIGRLEANQNASGQIPEHITDTGGTTFDRHEESTLLYLIRAYYDSIVRGLTISSTAPNLALTYINNQVTNNEYRTDNSNSGAYQMWMDGFFFTNGTYNGYTQGLYCMALKCGKLLGLNITDGDIANAISKYQALYDSSLGFIKFASDKSLIAPDVLVGEALSIKFFGVKMLTQVAVLSTLNSMKKASTPGGVKVISDSNGAYISSGNFSGGVSQGDYQNGGSWFLYEYLAYYVGFFHGYSPIRSTIYGRINQEMAIENLLHEFITTKSDLSYYLTEDPSRHVYSWNSAYVSFTTPPRQPVI